MTYNLLEATSNGHWEYYLIETTHEDINLNRRIRAYRHIKTDSIQVLSEDKDICLEIIKKIRLTLLEQTEIIKT